MENNLAAEQVGQDEVVGAAGVPPNRKGTDVVTNVTAHDPAPAGRPPRKPHRVFDRPRQPHDWRWAVGGIGRMLIIVGLLMFAFVAYQLWGTGIYTGQAQERLDDQFDELALPPTRAASTTTATTITAAPPTTTVPSTSGTTTAVTVPTTAAPATTAATGASTRSRVEYPFGAPQAGKVLVQLRIPRINVDYKVVEGVGLDDLAKGPGHFPESVLPGQLGNTAIAGHRTTHGAPFYDVDELDPGDQIILTYPRVGGVAPRFVYLVTRTVIVDPSDYADVVPTVDPARATLVLSSCHPRATAAKRIIVHAELDTTASSELFAATPQETTGTTSVLPGDDEAATAPTDDASTTAAAATGTASASSDPGATAAAVTSTSSAPSTSAATDTTSAATDTTAAATATDVTTPPASQDAFAGGWFDDDAAWPQIIGWGLALVAIASAGYLLARRSRRIWLGTLVAFAPFVLVLYFWFENIDRLLPPGL